MDSVPERPRPVIHDSGKRDTFTTGAVRDTNNDKPRPELVSPFALERLAQLYAEGANKYADRNWEKGMPYTRVIASLERHILKYKQGLRDEDHLAAAAWNVFALMHYDAMIELGILPTTLDDMPDYRPRPTTKSPSHAPM
jgi:hypothetical protein